MLIACAMLAPEVILEGGWRAWMASIGIPFLVWDFVDELRSAIKRRRRRRARPASGSGSP